MASYGLLHPKFVFGLNAQCKGINVYFLDASTIIYPAGNTIVMYNMDQKSQKFLHGVEKSKGITSFAISNTKVYGAVAQLGMDQKPAISIFDLKLNKRRKTLQFNDITAKEYISMAFTQDGNQLASLTGPPDYNVIFWKWDKARMLSQAKTTGGPGPVYELSTSPVENNVMCAVGKASFRFFRYNDGHMKPFGFQRGDSYHFMCHTWLGKGDKLIAGTADGKLMLFERGEFRYEIQIPKIEDSRIAVKSQKSMSAVSDIDEFLGASGPVLHAQDSAGGALAAKPSTTLTKAATVYEWKEVTAIVAFSKGFAISYGAGNVVVFEEQLNFENPEEHYKPLHRINIPVETSEQEDRVVKSLTINTTEEVLVATTHNAQIYYFSLATAEIKDPSEMLFEHALCSFHYGAIIAMDIAIRKPLFVTAGKDNFIRVWNYVTMSQETAKEFGEEIHCISFHPSGLFILAGCTDKVRIFTVLMDDIRELYEFHIRGCRECRFSTGGHLFAAANGNVVQIYNTTFFDNVSNLKGHSNKIRKLKWSLDDNKLFSVGADGAIYEWDISTGKRSADYVERGSNLLDDAYTPDSKTHYAISGQKLIKEIQIQDGIMLKELALGMLPFCIAMSKTGRILVAGLEEGVLRSFKQPLTYSNEWFDFHFHVDAVNAIGISFDEACCISCSEDGSIVVWKITDSEGRLTKQEKELLYSNEILVTKSDLEERDMAMKELKLKFGELRLDMEYQLKRKEMSFLEEIKSLKTNFNNEVSQLNSNIDVLIQAKEEHDADYHKFVDQMNKESKASMANLEAHYNAKLIGEYEKYNTLQNLLEETIQDYEARLVTLDNDRSAAIDDLVDYFEGKVKDKNSALEHAYNDARTQMTESEEMKKQIEEDADLEILQLTTSYERKLGIERELNAKLKGEAGIMRKKFATMQKEIEEQKNEVQRLLQEGEKMKTVITLTEKEVSTLRKDLIDRDVNVHDKEKVIFELKKTNNELEKFKFVLDYKIKELKKMIEPKEREIIYLKQQNSDMERELEGIISVRNGLTLKVNDLTNKLRVTNSEYQSEKRLRWRLTVLIERIRGKMSLGMSMLQDYPSLKQIVKEMYDKYGHTLEVSKASNAEQEAICELVRQKNHLEMCLTSVKKKMSKDVEFTRAEQLKIMHENMLLVYEINNLRRELKFARDRILSYEIALGVTASSQASKQAEMRVKLQNAIVEREEIEIGHNKTLEARENMIEAQQYEIESLANKIMKVQDFMNDVRPETVPAHSANVIKDMLGQGEY